MNKQQRFLDPAEVATRLGFGVEHVRRLIRAKAVPAVKISHRWRIDEITLNKWIDAHGGNARAA